MFRLSFACAGGGAAAVDPLRAQGVARFDAQPLLGLPVSIKDAFATQGLRTTSRVVAPWASASCVRGKPSKSAISPNQVPGSA